MDTFSTAPNTALGLSLHAPPPPSESPLVNNVRSIPLNTEFSDPSASLQHFLAPCFSTRLHNKLHNDVCGALPSRSAPSHVLPLRPSPQKLSFAYTPSSLLRWQPPNMPSTSLSLNGMSGLDINQVPHAGTDCDDISDSSCLLTAKRQRDRSSEAEQDRTCEVSSRGSDEEGEGGITRKKLRLSKEQSTLLEESFKEHNTLNPKQKAELAKQLNLKPRQVEVWFQNRRARTKLKQTEVDFELLKRCCESLTEENRRLQKEVQELRAIKTAAPCVISHDRFMPLPAATLSICPSCERVASNAVPLTTSPAQLCPQPSLSFSLSPSPPPQQLHHGHHLPLQPPHHALPSAAC